MWNAGHRKSNEDSFFGNSISAYFNQETAEYIENWGVGNGMRDAGWKTENLSYSVTEHILSSKKHSWS